jgi:hypothetical protein
MKDRGFTMGKNMHEKSAAKLPRMSPTQRALAAAHEAGHAVAHELIDDGIKYAKLQAKIVKEGAVEGVEWGHVISKPSELWVGNLAREFFCMYAGPWAERCYTFKPAHHYSDTAKLVRYANHLKVSEQEFLALCKKTKSRLNAWVRNMSVRRAINEVAQTLRTKKYISGDEVRAIVDKHGRDDMMRSIDRSILEPSVQWALAQKDRRSPVAYLRAEKKQSK